MFNSTTLEVAIGMALIYLLLSLFCTAINEAIAGVLGLRAKNLEKGIQSLFTDGLKTVAIDDGKGGKMPAVTLAKAIYNHGLVQSLYRSTPSEKASGFGRTFGSMLPSYIPSRIFASALFDVVLPGISAVSSSTSATGGQVTPEAAAAASAALHSNLTAMLSGLEALPNSKGKEAIVTLVKQAGGDVAKTRQAFETWYNDGMDRVAGWYKRRTQRALFIIGLFIAIGLNVDSIAVGRALWISPALRSYTVTTAEQYAQVNSKTLPSINAARDLSTLGSFALPIGWTSSKYPWMKEEGVGQSYSQSFSKLSLFIVIIGWFLTAVAMTLGAPFWFDTLNQFMVVRSTIKPAENS
jgi:hypothetical protein